MGLIMKTTIFITIMMLLSGCGQEKQGHFPVDISMTEIVWQGYPYDNPALLEKFNETMDCLEEFNIARQNYPYIYIVNGLFTCGDAGHDGCSYLNVVYFSKTDKTLIYLHDVYKHEIIHWATKSGNETHGMPYYEKCSPPPLVPYY